MTFTWPVLLFLLMLVPVAVYLYARQQRRWRERMARAGSLGFTQSAGGQRPGKRRHVPMMFFLAGLTLLIVALARPQAVVSLPRLEGLVILAFDVSGSMAADDMQPNRMEAAKAAAMRFVERQPPSVQVGVVAFSDNGFSVQSPTSSREEILAAIARLTPERGTSLANGIQASLNTINSARVRGVLGETEGEPGSLSNRTPTPTPSPTPLPQGMYTSASIVLLTDGENNQNPDPLELAKLAAERGVRIYTIGIGSAAGANIKVEGFTINTKLNEELLKQISEQTGGAYYNAQDEENLREIYENLDPELAIRAEQTEVTSLFAGASMLAFLIGGILSLLWFGRMP